MFGVLSRKLLLMFNFYQYEIKNMTNGALFLHTGWVDLRIRGCCLKRRNISVLCLWHDGCRTAVSLLHRWARHGRTRGKRPGTAEVFISVIDWRFSSRCSKPPAQVSQKTDGPAGGRRCSGTLVTFTPRSWSACRLQPLISCWVTAQTNKLCAC